MGGNEWTQGEKAREHGADVLSCADNPSGEACQRGIAENKAYAGALATARLIYLPGGMQITAGIGGTANAGIQYALTGEINSTDVLITTYVGAFTVNTGLGGTMGWNAAGGATSSYLNGDNPFKGVVISKAASGIGYGIGKAATTSLDKWINPAWKNYEWVNMGMGISKPLPLSPIPGISGSAVSSFVTEGTGQGGSKTINNLQRKAINEK